jgi:hypothetical protein
MHDLLLDSVRQVHNMTIRHKCFTESTMSYLKLKLKIDKGAFK